MSGIVPARQSELLSLAWNRGHGALVLQSMTSIAFAFLAAISASGQQAASPTSLNSIAAGMRDYARGITENRFDVSCKFSRFDPAGNLAKVSTKTHLLEFTKGSYKSSSEDAPADWNATWVVRGSRKTLGLALHTDEGVLFPVFVFSPKRRKLMVFDAAAGSNGKSFIVSFRPAEPCHAFTPMTKGFNLVNISCGSGEIVLDQNAEIPLRSSFEAGGFPLVNGKESMNGFHVDSNFAQLVVPGEKRPFLFPKKVAAVFTFSEGKTTVDCDYRLHPSSRK